jgi:uncharacterized RDD family membrane protein YckC
MAEPVHLGPHAPGRRRSLVTPEGIDLSLGLATGGQRVGAFVIDLMIMLFALTALTLLALWIGGSALSSGSLVTLEIVAAIWQLGFFLIRSGYFIFFEGGRRAATLGKRSVGLRVVARTGERLTLESVVARNLMREIEVFLPISFLFQSAAAGASSPWLTLAGMGWVLLFLLFPLFNKDRLRVGDLLAGTWVVSVPRRRLSYDLVSQGPPEGTIGFTPEQLDAYGVFEVQTLERVLRDAQPETVRLVAATIRQKIGHAEHTDDFDFLTAYYAAARAHMERGLLFGRRRADKFDR